MRQSTPNSRQTNNQNQSSSNEWEIEWPQNSSTWSVPDDSQIDYKKLTQNPDVANLTRFSEPIDFV